MDRRPLHLAIALALVAVLLGASTALVTEVREELLAAQQPAPDPRVSAAAPDKQGLPVEEFTLLDPAQARFGKVDRSGTVMTLEGPAVLELDEGDAIQVAPVPLPTGATVTATGGATLEGNRLTCPQGCRVDSDLGPLALPPNASLALPPQQAQGLTEAELEPGSTLDVGTGTELYLAPITMQEATTLPLGPGTTIILPGDQTALPADPSNGRHTLPAGTLVRGASTNPPDVEDLLERGRAGPGRPATMDRAAAERAVIEITSVPESIQKGVPFTVRGTVHTPDGDPSKGHPITLFANTSKDAPGFVIHVSGNETAANGVFETTAVVPTERPAQPYHIVGLAHQRLDHDPPMLEGWSDPIVGVRADTHLVPDLPHEEGNRVPVTFRALLLDEHDAPVPGQRVHFQLEGTRHSISAITDPTGQAVAVLQDGFPFPGTWNVSIAFDGTEHLSPTETWQNVNIRDARIETAPTVVAPRGELATLPGRVLVEGRPAGNTALTAVLANRTSGTMTSANGSFELPFEVPSDLEVGNYSMRLTTEGVTAHRTVVVTVTGNVRLSSQAPERSPLGGTLPLHVTAADERGTPLSGLVVSATVPGGAQHRAITDGRGEAVVAASLSSLGRWNVTLQSPGSALYAAATKEVSVRVGELQMVSDVRLVPASTRNATVQLAVEGQPVDEEPVRLSGPAFQVATVTDGNGTATFQVPLAHNTPTGPFQATLELPRYNLQRTLPATVLDQARLQVAVLEEGTDGAPVRLDVRVLGTAGGLPGVPLTAKAQGAFEATGRAVTDDQGRAELLIDRPRDADGEVLLTVLAEETPTSGPAVETAQAAVTPAPVPWWTVAPVTLVAVVGGVLWLRRREPHPEEPDRPRLSLRIAPQGERLPPVWHPDEPTELQVRLQDRHGAPVQGAMVVVEGPSGRAQVTTEADGSATLPIPASQGTDVSFRATFEGTPTVDAAQATLDVRLVDYREEIDREYRNLQASVAQAGRCGTDATPRELARALEPRHQAHRLATLFERSDYSQHPVDREDYVAFMDAKQAVMASATQ